MKRSVLAVAIAATALTFGAPVHAQKTTPVHPGKAGSPHVRTEAAVDGANISVEYGRPSLKGRVPGKDIDPFDGKEWRTGADEATTLKTDKPLTFGDLKVPAGTYTLYTIPTGGTWHLVISKKTGQWGIPYPKDTEIGRTPLTSRTLATPIESFSMWLIPAADGSAGGEIRFAWGTREFSAKFRLK